MTLIQLLMIVLNSADLFEPQSHREHRANSLRIKIHRVELYPWGEIAFQGARRNSLCVLYASVVHCIF